MYEPLRSEVIRVVHNKYLIARNRFRKNALPFHARCAMLRGNK